MSLLEVGKIVNTHGLHGEVKVVAWTDSPDMFEDIPYVYAVRRNGEVRLDIKVIKYQKNNLIIKFAQIDSIDEAESYKNCVLKTERKLLGELPDGVYYIADLIGMEVYDENGMLGKISDVFQTGANDIYAVKREGKKDLLLPVIDGVILNVDTENRRITAHVMEGLDDEN